MGTFSGIQQSSEVDTPMRMGSRANAGGAQNVGGVSVVSTSPVHNEGICDIDLSSPLNYGTPSSIGSINTPRSGIRGTPVRARPDIRTDKRMRQVNIGSDAVSLPT